MSQAKVVPVAIISAAAALVPASTNSAVRPFSTGKTEVSSHSISGIPSPIERLRIIARWVCQFCRERVTRRIEPSIVSATSSSPLLAQYEPSGWSRKSPCWTAPSWSIRRVPVTRRTPPSMDERAARPTQVFSISSRRPSLRNAAGSPPSRSPTCTG